MRIEGIYSAYIKQYFEFKRGLGYKLRDIEYIFSQFDRVTLEREETTIGITKELSDVWCEKRLNEKDGTRYARVSQLSLFARFLCNTGYPSYVPEVPRFRRSFVPYIFTRSEITSLFAASDSFKPGKITHDCSYQMMPALFRLLYGTGLRLGEALVLDEKDVNLKEKYIRVKQSKNGTERMVPLSESLTMVCLHYLEKKSKWLRHPSKSTLFFVKNNDSQCGGHSAYTAFRQILWKVGIPHKGKGLGPRLHDLRHTFACHSLATMIESGLDIYHSLPILSTYLGHRTLESTNKYVRLTSEMYPHLLQNVNEACSYIFPEIKNK
jgi:integrase/recombinase XerD